MAEKGWLKRKWTAINIYYHALAERASRFLEGLEERRGPAASFLIFATLYRALPRIKPGWREVFWGALAVALLLDVSEYLMGYYFTRVSRTQAVYGPLGIVIGLILWLYIVGMMIFLGAEIVQVLQKRRNLTA